MNKIQCTREWLCHGKIGKTTMVCMMLHSVAAGCREVTRDVALLCYTKILTGIEHTGRPLARLLIDFLET